MGTQIQAHALTPADYGGKDGCNDFLSLTRPDVIEANPGAYLAAGVDALETNTFQSSRFKLAEYGLGERTDEINCAAVGLARRAAARLEAPLMIDSTEWRVVEAALEQYPG